MADLIDRQELLKEICNSCDGWCDNTNCDCVNCKSEHRCDAVCEIADAPTVDAVEVVRCKECKWFADSKGKDSGKSCGYGQCKYVAGLSWIICADDFCSSGERRGEDG